MAKRGRRKEKIDINQWGEERRTEIINMIINQINSVNKKVKQFNKAGYKWYEEELKQRMNGYKAQYTKSGSLSKSKKFYKDQNLIFLKDTLVTISSFNNDPTRGTIAKYESNLFKSIQETRNYIKKQMESKGYDPSFIESSINDKRFVMDIINDINSFKELDSDQIIDEVSLKYHEKALGSDRSREVINNLEYANNKMLELQRKQEAFNAFEKQFREEQMRNKNMR